MGATQTSKTAKKKATGNLVNAFMEHTTKAAITSEMLSLGLIMDKSCHCVSDQMSAMDDDTLRNFTNVDKFTEAFVKGWKQWKLGEETEAFEIFCSMMK